MKIHHTRGVYSNGDFKDNGVLPEHLADHTEYNLTFRPGRAFIVDGVLVYQGGVGMDILAKHLGPDKVRTFTRCTMPYQ